MINYIKRKIVNLATTIATSKFLFLEGTSITGEQISADKALALSSVWAAVNLLSSSIGLLPAHLYREDDNGNRERVNSPTSRLLSTRPNVYMSASDFKETLMGSVLLWGNGYAEIERNNAGQPIALWPIAPQYVTPKFDERDRLYYEITNIKIDGRGNGVLLPEDIIHVKGLGDNGVLGYSVIRYAAENMALGLAAEHNAATFFNNSSTPAGILTTDLALSKDTKDKLEENWEAKHRGIANGSKVAIMHSGIKYQPISIPAADAQLLESRKFSVTDVARWFQVPPHKIGDLDRATYSNIEYQGIEFVQYSLQRWLVKIEQELTYKLLPARANTYFEFKTDALLRGDAKTRAEVYRIAIGGNNNPAYMTINEVRKKENLPLVDGGDDLFIPNYNQNSGSSNQDNTQNSSRAVIHKCLTDAWQRIIRAENKAIEKALKKPEKLDEWRDDFYTKHRQFAENILLPIAEAAGYSCAGAVIEDFIGGRRDAAQTPDNLAVINETEAAETLTQKIMGANNE